MIKKAFYTICTIEDDYLYKTSLPKQIIDHVKKYHGYDDTKKSIIAYNKLKEILAEYSHSSLESLYFNEQGKPCVEDGNISISHSNGLIVIAFSQFNIGVDIEKVGNASRGIYYKIFSKEEAEKADNLDFYKRWTLLEAKAKMNNTNIFDLNGLNEYNIFSKIEEFKDIQYVLTIISDDMEVEFERI